MHNRHDPVGQTRLTHQLQHEICALRRLVIGQQHDGVAGNDGGSNIRTGQGERVVPRGDDPHDAFGLVGFHGLREHRHGAAAAAVFKDARPMPPVVVGQLGRIEHLFKRTQPVLLRFALNGVENVVLMSEHELREPAKNSGAFADGGRRPH